VIDGPIGGDTGRDDRGTEGADAGELIYGGRRAVAAAHCWRQLNAPREEARPQGAGFLSSCFSPSLLVDFSPLRLDFPPGRKQRQILGAAGFDQRAGGGSRAAAGGRGERIRDGTRRLVRGSTGTGETGTATATAARASTSEQEAKGWESRNTGAEGWYWCWGRREVIGLIGTGERGEKRPSR
jgi:hypothetical protein